MYERLRRWHTERDLLNTLERNPDGELLLPDVQLRNPERAWRIWTLWEGLNHHLAPDVIERQDDDLLHDLIELSGLSAIVKRVLEAERQPVKPGRPDRPRGR